ncbi:uncharacterized protein LOC124414951 [Diprion similis]|uniref:uncharacterized protein LOC124414951 n=1 Tax=Diprion similis TaxID=362088 RepID=UPI001EF755D3|nr:uncharacterized protein LOC124414951 [Diprion similis]
MPGSKKGVFKFLEPMSATHLGALTTGSFLYCHDLLESGRLFKACVGCTDEEGTGTYNSNFESLMSRYGIKPYSTYRIKPSDVTITNKRLVLRLSYGGLRAKPSEPAKFKTGDKIRISKFKNLFEKGYTSNRTTEIFTISQVENTNPVTYKLKDYQGQPITGGFYVQELLKVEHPDIYLVEKVLKKQGK